MEQLAVNLEVATNQPNLQMFSVKDHHILKFLFHED